MLQMYTIPEALAELGKQTGRQWTESELFNAATTARITLSAAPPRTATITQWQFVIGEGLVARMRGLPWEMAVLHPAAIAELWQTGETETVHAKDRGETDIHYWFADPVLVRIDNARVSAESLRRIFTVHAQSKKLELAGPTAKAADESLGTKERNTLLAIIGVLCREARYDYTKHSKTATLLVDAAAKQGIALGESTVEGHLKKVAEALGTRAR